MSEAIHANQTSSERLAWSVILSVINSTLFICRIAANFNLEIIQVAWQ